MSDRDVTAGLADAEIVTFIGFVEGSEAALFARTRVTKPPYVICLRVDQEGRDAIDRFLRRGEVAVIDRSMGWVVRRPRASETITARRDGDPSFWFDVPRDASILVPADRSNDDANAVPAYRSTFLDDDEIPF